MAYRRPLTPTQMVIISALWLALVLWILFGGTRLDGPTLLTLLLSGVIVFYPIVKSWRQPTPLPPTYSYPLETCLGSL